MFDLLKPNVHFLEGWFKDTLPKHNATIGQIAVLRIDGDTYEATYQVLQFLYDQVAVGGYIVYDDYKFLESRKAWDDFRTERNITTPFHFVDTVDQIPYWQKDAVTG